MENLIHENFRNGTDRPERKIEFNGTDFAYIKILEQQLYVEEANNEMLIQELHNKDKEIEHLREEAKIAEYNNLFALFKKGYVLALPINSCVDVNELRVKFDEICSALAFNFK